MKMPAFAVVVHRGSVIHAYPAETREEAEASARGLAESAEVVVRVGVYELRATAIVERVVTLEGMA